MNPAIAPGVEKREWTSLDAAILQDIGWQFASATSVPEPGSMLLVLMSAGGFAYRRRNRDLAA